LIVSLKWLKNYIDIDNLSVDEIVEKLTTSGSEVDEVIDKSKELENIVVGYVEEVKKHPNADRLSVCKVTDGQETFDVVCGAPNVEKNQKVAFAKVGAIIPNGKFEIKKAKIRGEKSLGMLCAEDELGISDNHEGILVLNENAKVGEPIAKTLNLDDVVLDIAITPNRADSLSHIGLARDLAALYNKKIKYPALSKIGNITKNNELLEVIVILVFVRRTNRKLYTELYNGHIDGIEFCYRMYQDEKLRILFNKDFYIPLLVFKRDARFTDKELKSKVEELSINKTMTKDIIIDTFAVPLSKIKNINELYQYVQSAFDILEYD